MARIKPKPIPALSPERIKLFNGHVDRRGIDDCWPWLAACDKDGYGWFGLGPLGNFRAARISYFIDRNTDPGENLICHTCDNPPCVNPVHLFAASHYENMQDKIRKGRDARGDRQGRRLHPERWPKGDEHHARKHPECLARGVNHGCAKLSEDDVRAIRAAEQAPGLGVALAKRYNVWPTTIWAIRKRKIWKHLD